MSTRYARKKHLLIKTETIYGTDSVPTVSANAILAGLDYEFTPVEASQVDVRDVMDTFMGHQGEVIAGFVAKMAFSVEIQGGGSPLGTPPLWGPVMRGCGMAQVITASTDVRYNPVSTGQEALSVYFNHDGVRHRFLGARGNIQARIEAGKIPRWRYSLTGIAQPATDVAWAAPTLNTWPAPIIANDVNTVATIFGFSSPVHSLSIDWGNMIQLYQPINATRVEIEDRKVTGSVLIEQSTTALQDFFGLYRSKTKGSISLTHGTAVGSRVQITAPRVEIGAAGPKPVIR